MLLIEFARGDSYDRGFVLRDKQTKEVITDEFDEVYFTVKKTWTDEEFKLQKRKSTGGITYEGEGRYTLHILPEDTDEMQFGEYDCDIEVKNDNGFKRTFYGRMKLTKEVTHEINE